jgi:hypothetical protein
MPSTEPSNTRRALHTTLYSETHLQIEFNTDVKLFSTKSGVKAVAAREKSSALK